MHIQIKSRWRMSVLFEGEYGSMKLALEAAVRADANLTGANLYDANLTGADLTDANLTGADLTGADLTGANLTGANLYDANLTGADLTRANLYDANLTRANLTRANLYGANLTDADLTRANLTGAIKIVSVSGIGSCRRMTTFRIDTDEVWCGCFYGTFSQFRAKVAATYPDGPHRVQYDAAIAFFESCRSLTNQ